MKALALMELPRPETFALEIGRYRELYDYQIYPYSEHLDTILSTVASKGIKMPFERIVSMDMGISTCPHCGARYAGNNIKCTEKVHYYTYPERYHKSKGLPNREDVRYYGTNYKSIYETCETGLIWDLQEEFDAQKKFFDFVSFMSNLPDETLSIIAQNAQYLPPGSATEYRLIAVEEELANAKLALQNTFNALEEIAQKMNAAGNALTFNRGGY